MALAAWVGGGGAGCRSAGGVWPAARAAERPQDAVVHIFYANPDSPAVRQPSGTGFVIDASGVVVTAAHVVENDGLVDVKLVRPDGTEGVFLPARVVTLDRERDVALLKVDVTGHEDRVQAVEFGERAPGIGDPVAVFGFPESEIVGFEMRRSSGTISSIRSNPLDRSDTETRMLELEAKIEPGNSGSPVFNADHQVIGVVSSRWKTTDSYALAVPIEIVRGLLRERFERELRASNEELHMLPDAYLPRVRGARELAAAMLAVFPPGSEGERLVAQLDFCMERALREARQGQEAIERGDFASAWRHLQIVLYETQAHQQDVAFLRSTQRSLEASR